MQKSIPHATYNVKEGEIRLCAGNASHYKKKHRNTVKINQKLMTLIIRVRWGWDRGDKGRNYSSLGIPSFILSTFETTFIFYRYKTFKLTKIEQTS